MQYTEREDVGRPPSAKTSLFNIQWKKDDERNLFSFNLEHSPVDDDENLGCVHVIKKWKSIVGILITNNISETHDLQFMKSKMSLTA